MIPHVVAVEALPDYRLRLAFLSGEFKLFDVRPFLDKGLFRELQDETLFAQVRLALGTVEWPNGVDFDPEALFDLSVPIETN